MTITEKKEGTLVGLIKSYLDSKKFDPTLIKSIEPKRLVIGKGDKEISIKEDNCKMVMTYNDTAQDDDIDIGSAIRNVSGRTEETAKKIRLTTRKDSMNLDIRDDITAYSGSPGMRTHIGDASLSMTFRDYLKKPSEKTEIYDINCICQRGNLKCTATREEF